MPIEQLFSPLRGGISIEAKAKTKYSFNPVDWFDTAKKNNPDNLFKYEGLKEKPKTESLKKLHGQLVKFKSELLDYYKKWDQATKLGERYIKHKYQQV